MKDNKDKNSEQGVDVNAVNAYGSTGQRQDRAGNPGNGQSPQRATNESKKGAPHLKNGRRNN